jgi:hypothetical protein
MKTVTIPDDASEICQLLEKADDEDLIIELKDGRQFILSSIDDFDLELAQTRRNKKLMMFLDERSQQKERISLEEVKRRLGFANDD